MAAPSPKSVQMLAQFVNQAERRAQPVERHDLPGDGIPRFGRVLRRQRGRALRQHDTRRGPRRPRKPRR